MLMKFGFVSAILAEDSFEQVIDYAAGHGFECVELACWPKGRAERRYAGVSHLDVDGLTRERVEAVKSYCRKAGVEISSLAYYPNTMDPDLERRALFIGHLNKLIDASAELGIGMVTTFIGRISDRNVEENLVEFQKVWTPIIRHAEDAGVRIAIENCPMLFLQRAIWQ